MIAEQQMGGIVPGYGVGNFKEQLDDKSLTVKRKRGGEDDDDAFQATYEEVEDRGNSKGFLGVQEGGEGCSGLNDALRPNPMN